MRSRGRLTISTLLERFRIWLLALSVMILASCATLFPDLSPPAGIPVEAKRLSFTMVARNYRCEPSVIAVDREGRSALVKVTIRSDGARHVFSIPGLDVRRYLEPGQETTVEFLAERSGVFKFGCTRFPWISPLDHKGKLAIR
ncbi:MAG: cupredoxin domain-containing protein [candidate division NC10 bacterium]|nr:cupredoxin domain-containing protein [candidate division NC10 bacterium]